MKVAILIFNNAFRCPYLDTYKSFFDSKNIEYDIIEFNRSSLSESNYITIPWNDRKNKIVNFIHYKKEVYKILNNYNYDYVVVLTTIPAVLLSGILINKYKNRYIIDIRDYTHEGFKPFYFIEKRVVKYSKMNVISSPGFVNFLPNGNYVLCHNTAIIQLDEDYVFYRPLNRPIIVGYVGSIAYKEECLSFIRHIENDTRFEFHLYGEEINGNEVSSYLQSHKISNVKVFGRYNPNEKHNILNKIDILFNVYGNGNLIVKYALSNKLYDFLVYKKPLLTSSNTEMSRLSGRFSFDVDFENGELLDKIFEWYNSIDSNEFDDFCKINLSRIRKEQTVFYEKLESIFS